MAEREGKRPTHLTPVQRGTSLGEFGAPSSMSPVDMVHVSLESTRGGVPHHQRFGRGDSFRTSLLQRLHHNLATVPPDERGLMERFIVTDPAGGLGIHFVQEGVSDLISAALAGGTNPSQDALGTDLVSVAAAHFDLVGIVDPLTADLIISAPSRYLEKNPGLRERAFLTDIQQIVTENGGNPHDAQLASQAILTALGFDLPETLEPFRGAGQVFINTNGTFEPLGIEIPLSLTGETKERARIKALANSPNNLDALWVQPEGVLSPYPLLREVR